MYFNKLIKKVFLASSFLLSILSFSCSMLIIGEDKGGIEFILRSDSVLSKNNDYVISLSDEERNILDSQIITLTPNVTSGNATFNDLKPGFYYVKVCGKDDNNNYFVGEEKIEVKAGNTTSANIILRISFQTKATNDSILLTIPSVEYLDQMEGMTIHAHNITKGITRSAKLSSVPTEPVPYCYVNPGDTYQFEIEAPIYNYNGGGRGKKIFTSDYVKAEGGKGDLTLLLPASSNFDRESSKITFSEKFSFSNDITGFNPSYRLSYGKRSDGYAFFETEITESEAIISGNIYDDGVYNCDIPYPKLVVTLRDSNQESGGLKYVIDSSCSSDIDLSFLPPTVNLKAPAGAVLYEIVKGKGIKLTIPFRASSVKYAEIERTNNKDGSKTIIKKDFTSGSNSPLVVEDYLIEPDTEYCYYVTHKTGELSSYGENQSLTQTSPSVTLGAPAYNTINSVDFNPDTGLITFDSVPSLTSEYTNFLTTSGFKFGGFKFFYYYGNSPMDIAVDCFMSPDSKIFNVNEKLKQNKYEEITLDYFSCVLEHNNFDTNHFSYSFELPVEKMDAFKKIIKITPKNLQSQP